MSGLALPCPAHHPPPPGLTFLTGSLVRGVRAVGSVITFQEAVDAAAITTAELAGVAAARTHWGGVRPGGG